jgi:hypothetical protein
MSPAESAAVIESVKRHGFDPGVVRSCMPSSDLSRLGGVKGVVGCNQWDRCPFGLTRNGGFKGVSWRPKNIIYYLEPNDGTTHAKEDMMPCFLYAQLLQNKARDGRLDLEEGRNGEIIQIIGQEGDTYTENAFVKINSADPAQNSGWKNQESTKTCPEYVFPSTLAGQQHERDLRKKARERMAADPDAQMGPRRVAGNPNADWELETAEVENAKDV